MIYVAGAAKQGQSVMVRTVDSDVVVSCLYVFALPVTTFTVGGFQNKEEILIHPNMCSQYFMHFLVGLLFLCFPSEKKGKAISMHRKHRGIIAKL